MTANTAMPEIEKLWVYLRRSDGLEQQIEAGPHTRTACLYRRAAQVFQIDQNRVEMFLHGTRVPSDEATTLADLPLGPGSTLHVLQKVNSHQDPVTVCVWHRGAGHQFKIGSKSDFSGLRQAVALTLNQLPDGVQLSFMGKIVEDSESVQSYWIKNNDIISAQIVAEQKQNQDQACEKPHLLETATLATSDSPRISYQCCSKDKPKKLEMKSSQQLREVPIFQQNLIIFRHKSQSQLNRSEGDPKHSQDFDMYKHAWISDNRQIEAESVTIEIPDSEQDPQFWSQCKVELTNSDRTKLYIFDCSDDHNLESLLRLLGKCERKDPSLITLVFADETSQKMADEGTSIVEIARNNGTKIIHDVVFQ